MNIDERIKIMRENVTIYLTKSRDIARDIMLHKVRKSTNHLLVCPISWEPAMQGCEHVMYIDDGTRLVPMVDIVNMYLIDKAVDTVCFLGIEAYDTLGSVDGAIKFIQDNVVKRNHETYLTYTMNPL